MARALVPLAPGVEEMEAVAAIDIMRRAGWEVVAAGTSALEITASRGVRLLCDALWQDVDSGGFDVLVIPGGAAAADALSSHNGVLKTVRAFVESGRMVAAICAGPLVLQAAGILHGHRATCHPAVRHRIVQASELSDERVVVDGRIITSQAPGTVIEFALAIVSAADGPDAAATIAAGLVIHPPR